MPDVATATPNLGSGLPKVPALTSQGPQLADLNAAAKSEGEQLAAIEKRVNEADEKIEKRIGDLRPPKLELPPAPVPQQTDPQKAWGSAAMLAAALGSLMTRQPLLTAMNAAAGVLDAYHKGDQEQANAAYAQWKVSNENAMKLQQFQLESYRDILSQADRQERLIESEASRTEREVVAQFNATAASFRDNVMMDTANQHGMEGIVKLIDERERLHDQQLNNSAKLAEQQEFIKTWNAWQKEHPKATPEERFDKMTELQVKTMPSHQWSPSQAAHMEQTIAQQTSNSALGKAYQAAVQQEQTVQTMARPGVVAQAALADAYTQLINGGRAIRGFQMKMNTDHGSLWDKAQIAEHQLTTGGPLSDQMVADMKAISKQIVAERRAQFGEVVDQAQHRAEGMGLDKELVVPDIYRPEAPEPQAPPVTRDHIPADAIAMLKANKANPVYRKSFDKHFPAPDGKSWADQIAPQ